MITLLQSSFVRLPKSLRVRACAASNLIHRHHFILILLWECCEVEELRSGGQTHDESDLEASPSPPSTSTSNLDFLLSILPPSPHLASSSQAAKGDAAHPRHIPHTLLAPSSACPTVIATIVVTTALLLLAAPPHHPRPRHATRTIVHLLR